MMDRQASTEVALRPSAPAPMSDPEIEQTWRVSKALAASGFFKDARQAEQAFAKVLFGRDLGLTPTEAMTGLHIIEGRPEMSANLQASRVKSTPGYDYRIVEHSETECVIDYFRDGDAIGRSSFSMADAQKAGLGNKDVWRKYPRNMLFARCMSNGVAWHCPEVMGGMRVYSEGEVREAVEAEMIGSPADGPEDLGYLARPEQSEPSAPEAPRWSRDPFLSARGCRSVPAEVVAEAELARVDRAIDQLESAPVRDEDALAGLAGQRDALLDELGRL